MKSGAATRALALLARVARVREAQSKQELAHAIERRTEQRKRTAQAQACAARSGDALHGVLQAHRIDLARLPLLQELTWHADATLSNERCLLAERQQQVEEQTGTAGIRARYRERVEDRLASTQRSLQKSRDTRVLELSTEDWVTGRSGGQDA